ncbi:hypothetical protein [Halococcus hamelinensis]|uniref:Uncharacterized protein n=1 Tax=Halococcus hamelinensis 100A6 TaxID=1132509 RepID=M0LY06_9EURY|nr:hypothetical protein [Halococcus hamelinensis]EMA38472.1 hypothetical protein C447_09967 [Halococcus hamelinensis 100A6]
MTSTSDRAAGGVADLRPAMLGWLRDHRPLTERLEWIDSVEDGADAIRPPRYLQRARDADGDAPDIVLTVEVWTPNVTRANSETQRTHSGQVVLSLRYGVSEHLPGQWGDEVRAEIAACLTRYREGWYAPTVTGGDTELQPVDEINREELAITYGQTHRNWG